MAAATPTTNTEDVPPPVIDATKDLCSNEDDDDDLELSTDANNIGASESLGAKALLTDLKCKGKVLLEYTAEGVPYVR